MSLVIGWLARHAGVAGNEYAGTFFFLGGGEGSMVRARVTCTAGRRPCFNGRCWNEPESVIGAIII